MEESRFELPNAAICLDRLRRFIDEARNCEHCLKEMESAQEALEYLTFLLSGGSQWNWVRCNASQPVIRKEGA